MLAVALCNKYLVYREFSVLSPFPVLYSFPVQCEQPDRGLIHNPGFTLPLPVAPRFLHNTGYMHEGMHR